MSEDGERMPDLRDAMRRARLSDMERGGALTELRAVERARLELLNERLAPVLGQLPADLRLFDFALGGGERPRLQVDILAFVEMADDRRTYRFLQDTRWGREVLSESADLAAAADAVTNYIAERLIEREKALASQRFAPVTTMALTPPPAIDAAVARPPPAPSALSRATGLVWFLVGVLVGIALLAGAIAIATFALPNG